MLIVLTSSTLVSDPRLRTAAGTAQSSLVEAAGIGILTAWDVRERHWTAGTISIPHYIPLLRTVQPGIPILLVQSNVYFASRLLLERFFGGNTE